MTSEKMKSPTICPADFWIGIQTKYIKQREKLVETLSSLPAAHVIEITVSVRPR
jgi:hypothetical protein